MSYVHNSIYRLCSLANFCYRISAVDNELKCGKNRVDEKIHFNR